MSRKKLKPVEKTAGNIKMPAPERNDSDFLTPHPRSNKWLLYAALLIAVVVLFTYRGAFNNEFVDWDDFTYVVNNDLVKNNGETGLREIFTRPVSSNYHPVTILSMRLNSNSCKTCPQGISPAPFIRWNVILHILNSILVLVLVYLISRRNLFISFFTAIIFGVHPMHVESVAWIAERKDVLSSFFFLAGLIAYIIYRRGTGKAGAALIVSAFLLFVLACLSKATAVVFPLVLILLNFWISNTEEKKSPKDSLRETFSLKNLLILAPFFLVSFFLGMLAFRIQNGENFMGLLDLGKSAPDVVNAVGPFSFWQRAEVGSYGFIVYLVKFFTPFNLSNFYPYPGTPEFNSQALEIILKLSPAVFITILILVVYSLKKTSLLAFGTTFYLITIVLVLQFISVGYAIIADRYTYLPYIGLSFILAVFIDKTGGKRKKPAIFLAGCFIILMIFLSGKRIEVWRDTGTLWSNVIDKFPDVEISRRSRGKYYSKIALQAKNAVDKKTYEEKALTDFKVAIKSGSKNSEVFEGAGVIYGSTGDLQNAIVCLDKAVALDRSNGSIYYNRALTLSKMNRYDEAVSDYTQALELQPQKAQKIRTNRSNLLLDMSRFKEAIPDLDFLIDADRNNFVLYYNRAVARLQLNDREGAISDFQKVLMLKPDDVMSQLQLKKLTGR